MPISVGGRRQKALQAYVGAWVRASFFLAVFILADELTGSIAFPSSAVGALASARRGGKEVQKRGKGIFEKGEQFFHGASV